MNKDKIYNETIIKHLDGDITLGQLQKDVNAWNYIKGDTNSFGFTSKTVQSLIDKIIELQNEKKS